MIFSPRPNLCLVFLFLLSHTGYCPRCHSNSSWNATLNEQDSLVSVPSERQFNNWWINYAMSERPIIKLKMISVTLETQIWTNILCHTWISGVLFSSPLSVTAVSHVSSTMACGVCLCCCMCEQALYKSKAKDLLKSGCNELLRPDILTALYTSTMGSKVNSHRVVNHCKSDPCPQTSRI